MLNQVINMNTSCNFTKFLGRTLKCVSCFIHGVERCLFLVSIELSYFFSIPLQECDSLVFSLSECD